MDDEQRAEAKKASNKGIKLFLSFFLTIILSAEKSDEKSP